MKDPVHRHQCNEDFGNLADTQLVDPRRRYDVVKPYLLPYSGPERPGTIIASDGTFRAYLVLEDGRSVIAYEIGTSGSDRPTNARLTLKDIKKYPDWSPTPSQLLRQPNLPRRVFGGPGLYNSPLGDVALYPAENTFVRIHGTYDVITVGRRLTDGCFSMHNDDIKDLAKRVKKGATIVVVPGVPAGVNEPIRAPKIMISYDNVIPSPALANRSRPQARAQ